MNEQTLLDDIFVQMKNEKFIEGTEQYEICQCAVDFLGFSYKRSEELKTDTTVDCSTLTSQSHWEGALISIPFVADNQRQAISGVTIASLADAIPADVLIKYPSLNMSPDKTWNHVGLYLGKDSRGVQWLIESKSETGVILSKAEDFDPQGGIKRFTLDIEPFVGCVVNRALKIAPLIPKFGRLGVRQYLKSKNKRLPHKGIDVYVSSGIPVFATTYGKIQIFRDDFEDAIGVEVVGDTFTIRYKPINVNITNGATVQAGDLIGFTVEPSVNSNVQYSPIESSTCHVHIEVEVGGTRHIATEITIDEKRYANHLYLSKIGLLSLPLLL